MARNHMQQGKKGATGLICRLTLSVSILPLLSACDIGGGAFDTDNVSGTTKQSSQDALQAVSLTVADSTTGTTVYNGTTSTQSLTAGKEYLVRVALSSAGSASNVSVTAQNTSLPSSPAVSIPLNAGSGSFTPSAPGDYSFKVVVKNASNVVIGTKTVGLSVSCQSPTFTKGSLNGSGISISGTTSPYQVNVAGVVSTANGQGPYQCAVDVSGTGILSTPFQDCSLPVSTFIVDVQPHPISVLVKDACNTVWPVTTPGNVSIPFTEPTMPGSIFVEGTVSNEVAASPQTAAFATDPRIKGVHYLGVNDNLAQAPSYDGHNFTMTSWVNYRQASSVDYGMRVDIKGLGGTFNLRDNLNGSIDASSAYVDHIWYFTDKAGDQSPEIHLESGTCTTSGVHAQILSIDPGPPCDTGSIGGSNHRATVEVWADYNCTHVANAAGSVTISGRVDGYVYLLDKCIPGGSSSPGGVPQIHF